jgi:four helix bundle protein
MDDPEGFATWAEQEVPEVMREDPLWRFSAYRYALFLGDALQDDIYKLRDDIRTRSVVDQLLDAVLSISANIAEGYSRTTGPDRAKFFEYAHSSARESREWLFKSRKVIGRELATAHIILTTRIMKILVTTIPHVRAERMTRARETELRRADLRKVDAERDRRAAELGDAERSDPRRSRHARGRRPRPP